MSALEMMRAAVCTLAASSFAILACCTIRLFALEEGDLKDDKGEVIVHYAIETPRVMASPDSTDAAKQLGLFVCFHEHGGKAPDETYSVIRIAETVEAFGGLHRHWDEGRNDARLFTGGGSRARG